jgi:hypothetical protein
MSGLGGLEDETEHALLAVPLFRLCLKYSSGLRNEEPGMLGKGFCFAATLVTLLTRRGLRLNWSAQYRGKAGIDPAFDVLHDQFLVDVVEKVMKAALVEL